MHLLEVEVSGPKKRPWGLTNWLSSSSITPGSMVTQCSSRFTVSIFPQFFEKSTTMPLPTTCPASDVPAVRGISEIPCSFAIAINNFKSSFVFGRAIAMGTSR